jgi:RNA polymerase sigma factor (sigma-70 family)
MAHRTERYLTESILDDGPAGGHDGSPLARETEARIETALRRLKSTYREVICLRVYCEMPYRRIADAMGLPSKSTAETLFLRARAELRKRL